MFENRTHKELIIIYAFIAIVASLCLATIHYFQGINPYYIVVAVNIEFFCIFYILYLPVKAKRAREEKNKAKKKTEKKAKKK
jgi:heme O synthase-like polyprenyltransferase